MRLVLTDDLDNKVVEYSESVFKELLIQYFEVHKDLGKAFDLLSQDLLEKARTK